jgi:hypothetical protein
MRASSPFARLPLLAALAVPCAFAQAPATPTKPVPKPAAAKPAPKKPAPAPVAAAPLAPASPEQIEAAERTHFGPYDCDFSQKVDVSMNPKTAGYVDVAFKNQVWTMKPVLSSTGALRLEDVKGKMLMLQIANKSMLMDVQAGRRIVDECVHANQADAARAVKAAGDSPLLTTNPTPLPTK